MPCPYKPVELGDEMELRVSNALMNFPIEEVLSSSYRIHVKRKDMSTLQPSQWLNDEIINFYCSMIADRSTQQRGEFNLNIPFRIWAVRFNTVVLATLPFSQAFAYCTYLQYFLLHATERQRLRQRKAVD